MSLAVFLDPGYSSGVAVLSAGELDLYQVVAGEGWTGRVVLAELARHVALAHGRIALGVLELGWHRRGRSRQSSSGLALNAGVWVGALDVSRWEQEGPSWKNVTGWELEVRQWLHEVKGPTAPVDADAYDALGLMLFWVRRNAKKRRRAVRFAVQAARAVECVSYRVLTA